MRSRFAQCERVTRDREGKAQISTYGCWRDYVDVERFRVPIDPASETRKRDGLVERQAALTRGANAAVEQALIRALPARYPSREPVDDMQPWNLDYTNAMRTVYQAHPDDLDVRCIFVEAIMNETPWRMWDLKTGNVVIDAVIPGRCAAPPAPATITLNPSAAAPLAKATTA